ncbi:hypothetical protein NBRC116602_24000 [Hyphomicrobiales bacterium 4NK60-0047b]
MTIKHIILRIWNRIIGLNAIQKITQKKDKQENINPFFVTPPWEYVQNVTEYNLHRYLGLKASDIKTWCIVGGYVGNEVDVIMRNYPASKIDIFECSERYTEQLRKRFHSNEKVRVIEKAVSSVAGKISFHETSLTGSGSLLKIGELAKKSYDATAAETFEVEAITLDEFYDGKGVDILQIDVQGAEKLVLTGSVEMLKSTKAVFIEVSIHPDLYEGAVTFDELETFLKKNDFKLVLLGTDINLTGNALFLKSS